ncbi:MAG: T9SS type A sorting domain-containing protein, partial [Candidatus Marinimicrobia bacterium]|nr:T9SS type A sorting domain-containing protein [Candidatus Neomarinimicrobiota bacterium]
ESTIYTVQVKPEPDLIISAIKQAIDNYPALSTSVYYSGTDTLRNVKLRITEADGTLYGVDKFKIFPDIENVLSIKGELGHGTKNFIAEIDPDNKITENNENNNKSDPISMIINTFPILAEHGSSYTGNQNDTIRYDGHFSIYLPPGIVDDSGAVRIHPKKSQPNLYSQPDYQIIKLDSIYCYSVQFSEPPHKDFYIEFTTDIDSIKKTAAISRYSRRLKIWLCFKNEHAGKLAAYFSQAGQFALMLSEDNTDPYIELNIDGKQIYDGSYISEQPSISIIGEDKNGVNMTNNGLQVFLDSNPVDFNKFNIPDTIANGNYVTAQFRPELTCGNHNLKVELVDAAGNKGVKIIEFIISDDLKLKDYGNFPNPFKTQTTFIYELTRRVDILQIKIYTVAGRHIKTIDNKSHFNSGEDLRNSGYHEVTWDGLDKYGNFLANGVYFYKIYIKKDDKTKSSIGKIAKSR